MATNNTITFSLASITFFAILFTRDSAMEYGLQVLVITIAAGINIIYHALIVLGKSKPEQKTPFLYSLLLNSFIFVPVFIYETTNYLGFSRGHFLYAILIWLAYMILFVTLFFRQFPPKLPEIDEMPFY